MPVLITSNQPPQIPVSTGQIYHIPPVTFPGASTLSIQPTARRRKSEKTTLCPLCKTPDLFWSYSPIHRRTVLVDKNDERHSCEEEDLRPGSCAYCKATNLVWVKKGGSHPVATYGYKREKYELVESYGLKHVCPEYSQYYKDFLEARKLDYAWQKAKLNEIPDGKVCNKCKGTKVRLYVVPKSKAKYYTVDENRLMAKQCRWCKGLGVYSVEAKKAYLKSLRKKYWPFKFGKHKWSKGCP